MSIAHIEESEFHRSVVEDFGADDGESVLVPPELESLVGVWNSDGEVVKSLVIHRCLWILMKWHDEPRRSLRTQSCCLELLRDLCG